MESNSAEEDTLFSEVGNYFLNNDELHDVQFIVGEQQEKIKAVKLLLINQSRTWWSMLSEHSPLAEKGDIRLPDIDPEIFTLLLKHSYGGLEKLDDLSDDIVIKLCYCADKYHMKSLMTKIETRLQPGGVDSVFPALHCLVYFNLHGVEEGVKKIVQTKTKKIFAHAEFLECDVDSITYICKQDTLGCDELTLWKAVVSWAKHRAQSDDGTQLRQWMSNPLQHIRLFTLSESDLFHNVFCLEILNVKEIAKICSDDVSTILSLCNDKSCRHEEFITEITSVVTVDIEQQGSGYNTSLGFKKTSTSSIMVLNNKIVLQAISFRGFASKGLFLAYNAEMYSEKIQVDVSIKVTRIVTDLTRNSRKEEPIIVNAEGIEHFRLDRVTVPTVNSNKGITLLPNNKYKIELIFDKDMPCWIGPDCANGHKFDHGTFNCSLEYDLEGKGKTPCHIIQFTYGVADD